MASLQLQNVKYEKHNAMRRFQIKRNLENIFHLFNLCTAFFVFWRSSWFPITVQTFWHVYDVLMPLFNNSFYAFLLLNAIILFLYALSNNNNNVGGSTGSYDQCLKITAPETVKDPPESTPEKQNGTPDSSDNSEVGESCPVFEETVTAVTETTTCCTTVTTNGDKVSEKKCYRRVQSESYERRMVVAPRRELKRFNTGLNGQQQRRLRYVEHLSKDEFNRAVEDFIAKQKRMLLEEQIGSQKTEYLA